MYKEIDYLKFILEGLVSNIDDIKIDRLEDELGVLLTLSVAKEDMGIIIGKGGNTVNSLRSILRLLGVKIGKKINLKVLD
ncbi:MAG: KH domain-containing protein [Candidatus Gracilibacteria bacterium]|nr:KH domain-containing protein [Candidatus Gracilibacteria bacterium]